MSNIWVPLSAAIAQQRNVETIANNVANANTPGFKKDRLVFKEYLSALNKTPDITDLPQKEWAPEDFYRSHGSENGHVKTDASFTDFDQGQLSPTGNPLDLAINGKGFFEILTPNGLRYSRKGVFGISANGDLVTSEGHLVLSRKEQNVSEDKEDIKQRSIKIPPGNITVNNEGKLFVNNTPVADLSIIEFVDPQNLKKEGSNLYINNQQNISSIENLKSTVHQGFIEESNVNAITEMSQLIKANRHFESIRRAIKTYDLISGKEVNDISKF